MWTLSDLKTRLVIPNNSSDAVITALEQEACEFFTARTGVYVGAERDVYEMWLNRPRRSVWLTGPVIPDSVSAVSYRAAYARDWVAFDPSVYEIINRKINFFPELFAMSSPVSAPIVTPWPQNEAPLVGPSSGLWPAWMTGIRVDYSQGFETGEVPQDVRNCVANLVGLFYRQRVTGNAATAQFLDDAPKERKNSTADRLPSTIAAVLEQWAIPSAAGFNNSQLVVKPLPE